MSNYAKNGEKSGVDIAIRYQKLVLYRPKESKITHIYGHSPYFDCYEQFFCNNLSAFSLPRDEAFLKSEQASFIFPCSILAAARRAYADSHSELISIILFISNIAPINSPDSNFLQPRPSKDFNH